MIEFIGLIVVLVLIFMVISWLISHALWIIFWLLMLGIAVYLYDNRIRIMRYISNFKWNFNLKAQLEKASDSDKLRYIHRIQLYTKEETTNALLDELVEFKRTGRLTEEEAYKVTRYLDSTIILLRVTTFSSNVCRKALETELIEFRQNLHRFQGIDDLNDLTEQTLKEMRGES